MPLARASYALSVATRCRIWLSHCVPQPARSAGLLLTNSERARAVSVICTTRPPPRPPRPPPPEVSCASNGAATSSAASAIPLIDFPHVCGGSVGECIQYPRHTRGGMGHPEVVITSAARDLLFPLLPSRSLATLVMTASVLLCRH